MWMIGLILGLQVAHSGFTGDRIRIQDEFLRCTQRCEENKDDERVRRCIEICDQNFTNRCVQLAREECGSNSPAKCSTYYPNIDECRRVSERLKARVSYKKSTR